MVISQQRPQENFPKIPHTFWQSGNIPGVTHRLSHLDSRWRSTSWWWRMFPRRYWGHTCTFPPGMKTHVATWGHLTGTPSSRAASSCLTPDPRHQLCDSRWSLTGWTSRWDLSRSCLTGGRILLFPGPTQWRDLRWRQIKEGNKFIVTPHEGFFSKQQKHLLSLNKVVFLLFLLALTVQL